MLRSRESATAGNGTKVFDMIHESTKRQAAELVNCKRCDCLRAWSAMRAISVSGVSPKSVLASLKIQHQTASDAPTTDASLHNCSVDTRADLPAHIGTGGVGGPVRDGRARCTGLCSEARQDYLCTDRAPVVALPPFPSVMIVLDAFTAVCGVRVPAVG